MSKGVLHLDVETKSTRDLRETGAYVYAEHPTTDMWCACYALDDGPIERWHPHQECPAVIAEHVEAGGDFAAHNAQFERTIWRYILGPRYRWPQPRVDQWYCTAALAAAMALPRSLDGAAQVMGLLDRKDMEGHRLMLQMCKPRTPAVAGCQGCGGTGDWHGEPCPCITWWDAPEKVDRLTRYCGHDVQVERGLMPRLRPHSPTERALFLLDAEINDRGMAVDLDLVQKAKKIVDVEVKALNRQLYVLTNGMVSKVSQVQRIAVWLDLQGVTTESLDKEALEALLERDDIPAEKRRVIEIRAEGNKSSLGKLEAFIARTNADGRTRGSLLFNGAGTGRWAGVGVQPHNMVRGSGKTPDIDAALESLRREDPAWLFELMHGKPLTVVSDCLRSMITASPAAP